MPFVLIAVGLLLVVVGIRNTQSALAAQIVHDFTGPGNFFYWIIALFLIGAVGYIDELKAPSDAMIALVIIAILLRNPNVFQQFVTQLKAGSAKAPPPGPSVPTPSSGGSSGASSSSTSGGGISGGQLLQVGAIAASFL